MTGRGAVAALALLAALAGTAGCVFGTFDDITRRESVRPEPERCGECHREIYREWSASAHARSWTDERYAETTADHAFESCLPCHAPDSVYDEETLELRDVGRAHGIDCVACHLDEGALVGPLPSTAVLRPHPIRQAKEIYLRSDLCGRCHEGTFAEWTGARDPAGNEKPTCQTCHMPEVVRTVTQADDALSTVLVAMETPHVQRRHRFDLDPTPNGRAAADLLLETRERTVEVRVASHLPHRLPTGDYGPRALEVRLAFAGPEGLDAGGATLVYSPRDGTAVAPFGSSTRSVPRPPGAVSVAATLVRPTPDPDGEPIVLGRAEARW